MNETVNPKSRESLFRAAIGAFIEERRQAKEKDKNYDPAKYEYGSWLADAARRVEQIQAVTHVLKATHPDARGSSLHRVPADLPRHRQVGTHLLAGDFPVDVVGNAAALDVFKFLKTEVEGKRLLDWMQSGDSDLLAALSQDAATASEWMQAFASLVRQEAAPASHAMAKQLYWLVGEMPAEDSEYHLLQPLFSSSLAHVVHAEIQDARFGEANKLARQAKRDNKPHDDVYRDYPGMTVRKLGGTKPQNISQLNSERGGVNYLLSSLPPKWTTDNSIRLLRVDTVLGALRRFDEVPDLLKTLAELLLSDPARTLATRDKREALEQAMGTQLALFGESIRLAQEPGWTRHPDCQLQLCEKLWLDPERVELPLRENKADAEKDAEFNAAHTWGDWPDQVAGRFANWLNDYLRAKGLNALGDVEYKHWARQALLEVSWPVPLQRRAPGGGV